MISISALEAEEKKAAAALKELRTAAKKKEEVDLLRIKQIAAKRAAFQSIGVSVLSAVERGILRLDVLVDIMNKIGVENVGAVESLLAELKKSIAAQAPQQTK